MKQCFWVKGKPKKLKETVGRNLAPGCEKMEFGEEYMGKNLKKIGRVTSAIKCNAHCVENSKCKAWVWGMAKGRPNTNVCILKKSWKKKQGNPDVVSGIPKRGVKKSKKLVKASKLAMVDGYARLKRAQRLERRQVIRRIKRQQKLAFYRTMQKMRARQTLERLAEMRKLRKIHKKMRKTYLCRMKGKCPMPGERPKRKYLGLKKKFEKVKIPKKIPKSEKKMKKMLKDLKKKKRRLKKDKKKLKKLLKVKKKLKLDDLDDKSKDSDDLDKDFQQFKRELFDDYEDNDDYKPRKPPRTERILGDSSAHLYGSVWSDHDRSKQKSVRKEVEKVISSSDLELGFDDTRRKI